MSIAQQLSGHVQMLFQHSIQAFSSQCMSLTSCPAHVLDQSSLKRDQVQGRQKLEGADNKAAYRAITSLLHSESASTSAGESRKIKSSQTSSKDNVLRET